MVSEQVIDDVCVCPSAPVRGGGKAGEQLTLRWQHDRARHFTHERMVADLSSGRPPAGAGSAGA